jgi:hypothetical protein
MRNFRPLVLGLVLVILSPLGWGEDVYYCVEEHSATLEPTESGNAYELTQYKPETFTFKYEADSYRLAFKGRTWGGDELMYMQCEQCTPPTAYFDAVNNTGRFSMKDGRFFYSLASFRRASMQTGTCTKF